MRIDGVCHCGAIAYEAEVDPADLGICHCSDCQTLSGSAFRVNIRAEAADLVRIGVAVVGSAGRIPSRPAVLIAPGHRPAGGSSSFGQSRAT